MKNFNDAFNLNTDIQMRYIIFVLDYKIIPLLCFALFFNTKQLFFIERRKENVTGLHSSMKYLH